MHTFDFRTVSTVVLPQVSPSTIVVQFKMQHAESRARGSCLRVFVRASACSRIPI